MQVAWQKSEAVQQVWHAVVALLAYPHLWVRKAAGRLVGLLLSTAKLGTAQILTLPHHSCITVISHVCHWMSLVTTGCICNRHHELL